MAGRRGLLFVAVTLVAPLARALTDLGDAGAPPDAGSDGGFVVPQGALDAGAAVHGLSIGSPIPTCAPWPTCTSWGLPTCAPWPTCAVGGGANAALDAGGFHGVLGAAGGGASPPADAGTFYGVIGRPLFELGPGQPGPPP